MAMRPKDNLQTNLVSSVEESKDSLLPEILSPCAKIISAGTVMLKSTDNLYLPFLVSIESNYLVISSK